MIIHTIMSDMNFRQWLLETQIINEGVDVGIDIPPEKRKRESEDILSLCHELSNKLHYEYNHPIGFGVIEPDGGDYDKQEGLVNFYVGGMSGNAKGVTAQNVEKIVADAIRYLNGKGIKTGQPIKNTFQDYYDKQVEQYGKENAEGYLDSLRDQSKGNMRAIRVVRLPVKLNPDLIKAADMPPDISMGFDSAEAVFNGVFGLGSGGTSPMGAVMQSMTGQSMGQETEGGWDGWQFTADQIIKIWERMDASDKRMWAGMQEKEPSSLKKGDLVPGEEDWKGDQEYKGPEVYYGGLDSNLIMRRAQQVYELAKWAKKRGYNNMYAM